ncbi:unnamed protein product [Sphagnum jensenii]|uniref:O-fucosyltransferase family protein n=1 Tax=Sphagnum jensenii TaxID=128206 RepID=A0ABP1BBN6_9BRYO
MLRRSRMQVWVIWASTSTLLCICLIQLCTLKEEQWQPQLVPQNSWASCKRAFINPSPQRDYMNNGYLMVSCNGGLNQMRTGICDMVAIAKLLNMTLVLPELDHTSFWADPSDFGDIFDTGHFIASLRSSVQIVHELPRTVLKNIQEGSLAVYYMHPGSWSNESYYLNQILPLAQSYGVLHFNKTDTRLANSVPLDMQLLRCHVNYHALQFTPHIEKLGRKLVQILQTRGTFMVLHLRYEMDMLAFSGCTNGCTAEEADDLTRMRYAYTWWKEKVIVSEEKRKDGLCPLTPEETVLVLRGLGYDSKTQIYIAAGEIYGSERRMAKLRAAFPNVVRKEMLLTPEELKPFRNRSTQLAALDYMVSVASNVFIPTYYGNMAKVVEGHRRYMGFRKTIILDHKEIVNLVDQYMNKTINWENFSIAILQSHQNRMGIPTVREVIPGQPKEEDYFYANPQECLCPESYRNQLPISSS